MREAGLPIFYIAGEHDMLDEANGKEYLARFGKGTHGTGWYSFDQHGIHFVGLINVANLTAGGMGNFGDQQLRWLAKDLQGRSASTPVVVFAHMPLWSVCPEWGWGTQDGERALSYMRRFGSVTVLTGHTHQVIRKVEGNLSLHTAASTSFPEPPPGEGPAPVPMKVPPGKLYSVLGISTVSIIPGTRPLAITDLPLGGSPSAVATADASGAPTVQIVNFAYGPKQLTVPAGATVTWLNGDNFPHNIVATDKSFKSQTLAGGDRFSMTFAEPGEYAYFCTLHPYMTGKVIVTGK
jgi:plastocyanin